VEDNVKFPRKFVLDSFDESEADENEWGEGWAEVVGDQKVIQAAFCEFGFAEESIGVLFFESGKCVVGVGECLRPYYEVYTGTDQKEAFEAFWKEVTKHIWYE
jgi:hypothetical protein